MKRLNLYKRILKHILTVYSRLPNSNVSYKDIIDYIDADNIYGATNKLLDIHSLPDNLRPIILSIKETDNAELFDIIKTDFKKVLLYEKWEPNKKYERCFYYCSDSIFVMDADYLYKQKNDKEYTQQIWLYLEKLCIKKIDCEKLLEGIVNQKHHSYLMAYNKAALKYSQNATVSKEEIFSYALYASLHNMKTIMINQELNYDISTLTFPNIKFNKNVSYQQYYDIYDVINDWLHAKDLLSAFLRIYQIVEFLVYRQQMSEIIKVSSIKQSFIREVKTLNKKFENSERSTMIDAIPKLFTSLSATEISIKKAEPFIKKYLGKDKNLTNGYLHKGLKPQEKRIGIARFIYDIRCCIVHNKEAEFHISYSNYEEYKNIIPLLKEVHNHIALEIWNLINNPDSLISFGKKRKIDLF